MIKELGLRIRSIRLQNEIPQAEFARMLHINETLLAKIENGLERPNAWLLFILESNHGINVHWLMTGEGKMLIKNGQSKKDSVYMLTIYNRLSENSQKRIVNIIKMLIQSDHADMFKQIASEKL